MITGIKNNFLIVLLLFLVGCDPMSGYREPPFEIRGDPKLLKNMIINIRIDYNDRENIGSLSHRTQSLLYNGHIYPVVLNDGNDIVHYTICYSYNEQINTLSFDAVIPRLMMKKRESQVISVYKQGGGVYITYHTNGRSKNANKNFILVGRGTISQDIYFNKFNGANNDNQSYPLDCFFKLNK
ncbi:hypothetical protein ACVUCS_004497 [Salmonella enterica subsp. enterica]|nr:hypothetical protein [Salmonella enterica subsp. enterica serovar Volkmarsdorf]